MVRIEIGAASKQHEAFSLKFRFQRGRASDHEFLFKPYLHADEGKEFFVFCIPPDADKCEIQLRFASQAKSVNFTGFRAIFDPMEK